MSDEVIVREPYKIVDVRLRELPDAIANFGQAHGLTRD